MSSISDLTRTNGNGNGNGDGVGAEAACPASHGKVSKHYHLPAATNEGPAMKQTQSAFGTAPVLLSKLGADQAATQSTYDASAADMLADVAAWSYSDGQTLIEALAERAIVAHDVCCHEVSVSNEPMFVVATAFVIRTGNVAVLAFRGTMPSNAINVLTDVSVQTKDFAGIGRVHGGFHRNVRAVWPEIAERLLAAVSDRNPQQRLERLYITGHSLGGAMAVLAAATIHSDKAYAGLQKRLRGVYTYGQPMVGDDAFAERCKPQFGNLLFRHVYERDVVARLPPLSTGRFTHFGSEYGGSEKGWQKRAKSLVQTRTALISIPLGVLAFLFKQIPSLSRLRLPYSLYDHSPVTYLEAFRATRRATSEASREPDTLEASMVAAHGHSRPGPRRPAAVQSR